MEAISQLHPVAQVFAVVAIGVVVCVAIWQFGNFMRGE